MFGKEHKIDWAHWVLNRGFCTFESYLKDTKGKFCVGDEITLADVFLVTVVARFKVDMSPYTLINEVCENLSTVPEFIAARPENQPDAE